MAFTLLLASGAAVAVSKTGDSGNNTLKGTNGRDTLTGGGGHDRLYGKDARDRLYGDSGRDLVEGGDGSDQLFGGQGADRVFGGPRDDFINVLDEHDGDVVECGGDGDEVYADFGDTVSPNPPAGDCEWVVMIEVVPTNAGTLGAQELSALSEGTVVGK